MLLLSFYPPSKSTSCSSAALHQSSQIFQIFSYILKNVDENGSKLLQYEVHFDAEDKFCEGYEFEIDDTDQSIANNVSDKWALAPRFIRSQADEFLFQLLIKRMLSSKQTS